MGSTRFLPVLRLIKMTAGFTHATACHISFVSVSRYSSPGVDSLVYGAKPRSVTSYVPCHNESGDRSSNRGESTEGGYQVQIIFVIVDRLNRKTYATGCAHESKLCGQKNGYYVHGILHYLVSFMKWVKTRSVTLRASSKSSALTGFSVPGFAIPAKIAAHTWHLAIATSYCRSKGVR
jgi:hypothetical protein